MVSPSTTPRMSGGRGHFELLHDPAEQPKTNSE